MASRSGNRFISLVEVVIVLSAAAWLASQARPVRAATGNDWPTYLDGIARTGFGSGETVITASSAPSLRLRWTFASAGAASAEPVVVGGVTYWGSWDGHERATTSRGALMWSKFLNITSRRRCRPPSVGVASTATVGMARRAGTATPAVFVGGGDGYFYALNAHNGFVIWKTRLWTARGTFLWSSPAYYRGSIYEGVASVGDCPLVRGKLVRLNANTGAVQNTFYTVPAGCVGGGVWSAPAIDASAGKVYFATGNANPCSRREPMATALIEVGASNLRLIGHWRVPPSQHGRDSDFGATPTLFIAHHGVGGGVRAMVGLQNKNGVYYAFDRAHISAGPVWRARIAGPGPCPECGQGDISSSAWDGRYLFIAGGNVTIKGARCLGSLRAARPATGRVIWLRCLPYGAVLGAVAAVPGVVVVGTGPRLLALNARTGATLFQYRDPRRGSLFWSGASFSNGTLYVGNQDGRLYAFSP